MSRSMSKVKFLSCGAICGVKYWNSGSEYSVPLQSRFSLTRLGQSLKHWVARATACSGSLSSSPERSVHLQYLTC